MPKPGKLHSKNSAKNFPFHQVRRQIGKGSDQLLPVFFSKEELSNSVKSLDNYRSELFKKEYLPRVKAFPKVRELFQRIQKDGKEIVLASSAKADELEAYKKIARIEDLIESETSSDDADRSKPYPDIFQAALGQFGRHCARECDRDRRHSVRCRGGFKGELSNGWLTVRRVDRRRASKCRLSSDLSRCGRFAPEL